MRRFARWLVMTAFVVGASHTSAIAQRVGQGPAAGPGTRGAAADASKAKTSTPAPVDPAEEARTRARMEQLLEHWEKQSGKLKTLDASFKRIDTSPAWDEKETYHGRAFFQAPNQACLHFQKEEVDPSDAKKIGRVNFERIVCTGREVYQYEYKTTQIFIFPLDKEQGKKALDEGPLPFLFNMKVAETKQRYHMQLLRESETAFLIGVLPKLKEDASVFSQAYLQLNKKTFLPDRLVLISPNGKDTQDYVFDQVLANSPVNPDFFKGNRLSGWKVHFNPAPEQVRDAIQSRDPRRADPARSPANTPNQTGQRFRPSPNR